MRPSAGYKSWTNNLILSAVSVCALPIVLLIPCGMIKEIYEFVESAFVGMLKSGLCEDIL